MSKAAPKVAAAAAAAGGAASGIKGFARLLVPAGEAKPGPAIGQALGPLGLNMADFCKRFNADTSKMVPGAPIPVKVTAYKDRTFDFTKRTPPTSWLLKKAAGIERGSGTSGLEIAGMVTAKQIYEIALLKQQDAHLNKLKLEQICRMIVGGCKSMGIEVVVDDDLKQQPAPPQKNKAAP